MRAEPARVSIYDVAAQAGVSISTVSLVINAPHRVRADTRERVMAAATALGYRMAPGRRRGVTRIAVAAPFAAYPSYLDRLSGMMQRARDLAVDLIPYDIDSAAAATEPLLVTLPTRTDVQALIIMGVPLGGAARRASREARIPIIAVDVIPVPGDPGGTGVSVDDFSGGAQLGRHLAELGHERALFVHDAQRSDAYVSSGMRRAEGLLEHISLVPFSVEDPRTIDNGVLDAATQATATAIVASHDGLAARVLAVVRRRPASEQLPVVGYDDGALAEALELTTVRQPFSESGRAAIELALERVADATGPHREISLMPQLIVRASSYLGRGPANRADPVV